MARKTETITTVTCDMCGKKIEGRNEVRQGSNYSYIIETFEYNVYYGGTRVMRDFCLDCTKKIMDFILDGDDRLKGVRGDEIGKSK